MFDGVSGGLECWNFDGQTSSQLQALEAKFNDLVNESEDVYRKSAVGLLAGLLEAEAASSRKASSSCPVTMGAPASTLLLQSALSAHLPGVELRANLESISNFFEVAFVHALTSETMH